MHLLLGVLFIPVIASKQWNIGMNISLTSLSKTMGKSPPVIPVPGKEESQAPVILKRDKRQADLGNEAFQGTSLKWVAFQGTIPQGAFSIWNSYAERREYPCAIENCHGGFYSPNRGSFCLYPDGKVEHKSSRFWLLVNENDFEILEWHSGYYGSVPPNSVGTCSGDRFYIAKNKYGLGKVDRLNTAFYIGIDGSEYWYRYYDVLTVNKDYTFQKIYNVNYSEELGVYEKEPMTLKTTKLRNNNCRALKKKASLSVEITHECHWDFNNSFPLNTSFSLIAKIPEVIGLQWSISVIRRTMQNVTSSKSVKGVNTIGVEVEVPPNHECEFKLKGMKMKAEIPFSASVLRYYKNGVQKRAIVQGVSRSQVVKEFSAITYPCLPIQGEQSCSDFSA